jgi:hypothetical protein
MSWSYVEWCKFFIHLTSLNVRHCVMVATTALKLWHRGNLQWHDIPTKFHKNLPIVSKVDRGEHRQDGDLVGLNVSRRKESGLQMTNDKQIHANCELEE